MPDGPAAASVSRSQAYRHRANSRFFSLVHTPQRLRPRRENSSAASSSRPHISSPSPSLPVDLGTSPHLSPRVAFARAMDLDKDNANPTIIDASDLPSRRRAASTAKRPGIFDALAPAYPTFAHAYASSPETSQSELSSSDDEAASSSTSNDDVREEIDEQEVYDLISTISDPEHPLSLGSLGVVKLDDIQILGPPSARSRISTVRVLITPTTTACSLTTVIGLGVKVRLVNALPPRFRVDVRIKEGTSKTADEVNKQLGDKERVAAAMENRSLVNVVNTMLATCA
nr:mip18 family protein [Quercus suber]